MAQQIKTNTQTMQNILNTINSLPNAGGGSSGGNIETCTVTVIGSGTDMDLASGILEAHKYESGVITFSNVGTCYAS